MKISAFPYLAVILGAVMLMVVIKGSANDAEGNTLLPLLTLLVVSEFAFIVNAVGAFLGFKYLSTAQSKPVYAAVSVICVIFAVSFMWLGINLWPR